jgi:transcription elongation factor Elf1
VGDKETVVDDDEDDQPARAKKKHTEFECPECNAHNPVDDGYGEGSDVQCFYCGIEFKVTISNGRFKFRAV